MFYTSGKIYCPVTFSMLATPSSPNYANCERHWRRLRRLSLCVTDAEVNLSKGNRTMTVESNIKIYERDDEEFRGISYPIMTVRSVGTFSGTFVELEVGGVRYKVVARELQSAIQNAQNVT